jgi:hypothetical protein
MWKAVVGLGKLMASWIRIHNSAIKDPDTPGSVFFHLSDLLFRIMDPDPKELFFAAPQQESTRVVSQTINIHLARPSL